MTGKFVYKTDENIEVAYVFAIESPVLFVQICPSEEDAKVYDQSAQL